MKQTILLAIISGVTALAVYTGFQKAQAQQPLTDNPERFKVSVVGNYGPNNTALFLIHDTKTGKEFVGLQNVGLSPL